MPVRIKPINTSRMPELTRLGCWFGSDKTRLLVNFLPRWLIVIFILALYARLYRIIYKAHNRFMSFNDQMSPHNHASPSVEPDTDSVSSTRRIGRPSISMNVASKDHDVEHSGGTITGRTYARQPNPMLKKMARQMMSYPLAYMLIWTIPTTIRIYQSVKGKPAPFGIATVDKVSASLFTFSLAHRRAWLIRL